MAINYKTFANFNKTKIPPYILGIHILKHNVEIDYNCLES